MSLFRDNPEPAGLLAKAEHIYSRNASEVPDLKHVVCPETGRHTLILSKQEGCPGASASDTVRTRD